MKQLTFVVVDDALFMRTFLRKLIEEEAGYTVVGEASNGLEAIKEIEKKAPDIVTLDITMPDMDGLTALKEILKVSPNSRVIMVSAMGQKAVVIDAIKAGARDFVIKPLEKSRVMQAIRNVTSS